MTYIFFDESGDLGFNFSKKGTSAVFSIAFLIVKNKRPIISLVKRVFKSLPLAVKRKNSGLLHASHEKDSTIKKLLHGLAAKDVQIASIRLDKHSALVIGNSHSLYSEMVTTLINRLYAKGIFNDVAAITLVASQRDTNKNLNNLFTSSITSNTAISPLTVNIIKPADDKCLQAADFVSWALWQKYTKDDESFVYLIADKIICEYEMYK